MGFFGVQRYHTFESSFLFPKVREVTSVEGGIVNRFSTNLDFPEIRAFPLSSGVRSCDVAII